MEKINLFDINNNRVQVYLVRFFKYNNDKYLIYTLNEQDLKGYIKLYLVKITQDFGRTLSYHISDEEEWKMTQELLKNILGEIKYNKPRTFEDLNSNIINGMKIEKARVFKFEKNLVDLLLESDQIVLGKNQNINPTENQLLTPSDNQTTYKKQLEEAEVEIARLNQIMGDLLAENIQYKTKYGDLNK